jgi:hypothetical protein
MLLYTCCFYPSAAAGQPALLVVLLNTFRFQRYLCMHAQNIC